MRLKAFLMTLAAVAVWIKPLSAEIKGRVDVGPAYIEVDVLQSGKTAHTRHLWAIRGDATIVFWKGIFLKPTVTWGEGNARLAIGGIGIGQCIPITDDLMLMPSVGVVWSYFRTKIDYEVSGLPTFEDLTEKFRSRSPYIALEFSYKIDPKWTLMGVYQYAWSQTHTDIEPLISNEKSHSCGPNYSLAIDYSINCNWSVSLGVGYNITLSKEKHGLRGKGAKLGLVYYF